MKEKADGKEEDNLYLDDIKMSVFVVQDIIGQTTETIVNSGFHEVCPNSFPGSCNSYSRYGIGDKKGDNFLPVA